MSKISTVRYLGDLRTQATHLASGNQIITDAPTDNHGKGENFSPSDLVASALCSCLMTIIAIKSSQMELEFEMHADVQKIMNADPRRIKEIIIDIHIDANLDAKTRTILEKAAHTCPVANSISETTTQTIHFHYQ